MGKSLVRVDVNEVELADVIREALDGLTLETVKPNYRLAAHGFLNYMDAALSAGRIPDKFVAAGHLFFALHNLRPAEGEDVAAMLLDLTPRYRPAIIAAGDAAWDYFSERVKEGQTVTRQ